MQQGYFSEEPSQHESTPMSPPQVFIASPPESHDPDSLSPSRVPSPTPPSPPPMALLLALDERQMCYLLVIFLRHLLAPFSLSPKPRLSLFQCVTSGYMFHLQEGKIHSRGRPVRSLCSSLVHPVHGRDGSASAPRKSTPVGGAQNPSHAYSDPPQDGLGNDRDRTSHQYLPGLLSHGHGLHIHPHPRPRPKIPRKVPEDDQAGRVRVG